MILNEYSNWSTFIDTTMKKTFILSLLGFGVLCAMCVCDKLTFYDEDEIKKKRFVAQKLFGYRI